MEIKTTITNQFLPAVSAESSWNIQSSSTQTTAASIYVFILSCLTLLLSLSYVMFIGILAINSFIWVSWPMDRWIKIHFVTLVTRLDMSDVICIMLYHVWSNMKQSNILNPVEQKCIRVRRGIK
jgi:hypothetical protein